MLAVLFSGADLKVLQAMGAPVDQFSTLEALPSGTAPRTEMWSLHTNPACALIRADPAAEPFNFMTAPVGDRAAVGGCPACAEFGSWCDLTNGFRTVLQAASDLQSVRQLLGRRFVRPSTGRRALAVLNGLLLHLAMDPLVPSGPFIPYEPLALWAESQRDVLWAQLTPLRAAAAARWGTAHPGPATVLLSVAGSLAFRPDARAAQVSALLSATLVASDAGTPYRWLVLAVSPRDAQTLLLRRGVLRLGEVEPHDSVNMWRLFTDLAVSDVPFPVALDTARAVASGAAVPEAVAAGASAHTVAC